jgi:hypothetical protein
VIDQKVDGIKVFVVLEKGCVKYPIPRTTFNLDRWGNFKKDGSVIRRNTSVIVKN